MENSMCQPNGDNVGLQLTKAEVIALSVYFIDKDNDIEGYDIDEVVDRIKGLADKYKGASI